MLETMKTLCQNNYILEDLEDALCQVAKLVRMKKRSILKQIEKEQTQIRNEIAFASNVGTKEGSENTIRFVKDCVLSPIGIDIHSNEICNGELKRTGFQSTEISVSKGGITQSNDVTKEKLNPTMFSERRNTRAMLREIEENQMKLLGHQAKVCISPEVVTKESKVTTQPLDVIIVINPTLHEYHRHKHCLSEISFSSFPGDPLLDFF